ncbi:NADH-quinone oxidoreductase subunit L [Marinobacterium jannaschii]|uniref:NADH-quinone oxidoreductase subunit L n=1 Tax=Marinobacterium jannaschii TaxID=64970 RepID=UPI0004808039|nr:NADH-quinone oxidoreductase subunit L [Marinobacterium jannaschii]
MSGVLWLIPALPLFSAMILISGQGRFRQRPVMALGVGSLLLAFVSALIATVEFLLSDVSGLSQPLWRWLSLEGLSVRFGLWFDPLSMVMALVVTGVGLLIHLYAAGYMYNDPGYCRFFAYMNLFVASMLILVLAGNLLLLYLGWEGVGLCSYLLIGFWYQQEKNALAARKAFIITRIGDTALLIALFLIYSLFGTLDISRITESVSDVIAKPDTLSALIALLLLLGACGKSAQLPLHTWLPDAMAGPTPVSALIHAATMVTAGVYLIARLQALFLIHPEVELVLAWVGGLTLFIAACSALVQTDLKRILAYSTISQIGYMFLALGVGAGSFAIFHLVTHAFFKALLFLSAGSVIMHMKHEQNIYLMGGLRRFVTAPFWGFVTGVFALAALPLSSGYFSKEPILLFAAQQQMALWLLAAAGAFITALYSFRMLFVVFFGQPQTRPHRLPLPQAPRRMMAIALLSLVLLSLLGGLLQPDLSSVLQEQYLLAAHGQEWLSLALPLLGLLLAWQLYYKRPLWSNRIRALPLPARLQSAFFEGWGFDRLYQRLISAPFCRLAEANRADLADLVSRIPEQLSQTLSHLLRFSQSGLTRWYAAAMVVGVIVLIGTGAAL